MKRMIAAWMIGMIAGSALAVPVKVAVLDFEDRTGMAPDELLGGVIRPGLWREKAWTCWPGISSGWNRSCWWTGATSSTRWSN